MVQEARTGGVGLPAPRTAAPAGTGNATGATELYSQPHTRYPFGSWYAAVSPMTGRTVSHYRIIEKLGGGGMGVRYLAEDTRLRRIVFLKILPAELSADAQTRERFFREAGTAGSFDHPHIAGVHEAGETPEGQLYLAMAYAPGKSLEERLAAGPLELRDALKAATQAAEALEAAHAHGIVHQNINPRSILISEEGDVKLVGFGLAKAGDVKGTLAYRSPEQAGGKEVDARTDIWSLGAVLAECVSGTSVFEVERIVKKCLQKDPRDRYASATELAADLKAVRMGRMLKRSRVPLLTGTIGGLLLIAAALVVVLWWKPWTARVQERVTIALLPLVDAGLPAGEEWYAEGMTDSLMTNLVKIHGLRVISQGSARQIEADETIAQVGRKLGVDYVLKGSIGKDGKNARLTMQAWEVAQERKSWEKVYTKASAYLDALAAEVAQEGARRVGVSVTADDKARIAAKPAISPEAYELFMKGWQLTDDQANLPALKKGIEYLARVVALEPEFPDAWAYLGFAYISASYIAMQAFAEPDLVVKGKLAARRALELDPANAEASLAIGYAALFEAEFMGQVDQWNIAETSLTAAIAANPDLALAHATYGLYLGLFKRFDEALAETLIAVSLDPLSLTVNQNLCVQYLWNRRLDEGIPVFEQIIDMAPDVPFLHLLYGIMLAGAGRFEEALEAEHQAIALGQAEGKALLGWVYAKSGDVARARAIAREIERAWDPHVNPYGAADIATIYASTHQEDLAMQWLEKAIAAGSPPANMNVDPPWDPLRDIPRFREIIRSQGLPE